jgi:hypothetical protein
MHGIEKQDQGWAGIGWWEHPLSCLDHRNNYTGDPGDSCSGPLLFLYSFAFPLRLCAFAVKIYIEEL